MIVERIRERVVPGVIIPKPVATADFTVKGWGTRRGESALIYYIPNHKTPARPYQKGITVSEFASAYRQLQGAGEITRGRFRTRLPACAKEGGCNYTTIGGIFESIGLAKYVGNGVYRLVK
jgi:hypothetical protein